MTTHIYKGNQVISDSRLTYNGSRIVDDNLDKAFSFESLMMFIAGDPAGVKDIIKAMMSEDPIQGNYDIIAFVWDTRVKRLFLVSSSEGGQSQRIEIDTDKYYSIGSGASYALGALDAGVDAKKAMKIAIGRDPFSGGKIRVTKLK